MTNESASFAERGAAKLVFEHRDMDYYLAWIIGREIYDGAVREECIEVARRITDGDAESWRSAWAAHADLVEAEANVAAMKGEAQEACSKFRHACTYHRAPLFLMHPEDQQFRPRAHRMRACFERAAELSTPPIERIEVPFDGRMLPGYAWGASSASRSSASDAPIPRPTLIVFGGVETFAEDCYFMVGPEGPSHGYTVVSVDVPGQGFLPDEGLYFGAQMEDPVSAVIDYVQGRQDVDPERVAIFGFSWGGHIVFKGARHDERVRAMIANPPMPDVFRGVLGQQQGHDRKDPIARVVFDQIVWRMGLRISWNPRDIRRRMGKAYDYYFHGKVDPAHIRIPVLMLAGEDEAAVTLKIARETAEKLPHPASRLRIFTREEGGAAHCQVDNLALPNGVMFEWLAEVLGEQAVPDLPS